MVSGDGILDHETFPAKFAELHEKKNNLAEREVWFSCAHSPRTDLALSRLERLLATTFF